MRYWFYMPFKAALEIYCLDLKVIRRTNALKATIKLYKLISKRRKFRYAFQPVPLMWLVYNKPLRSHGPHLSLPIINKRPSFPALRLAHYRISTTTTHIGCSCPCSSSQSRFVSFWVTGLGQSKAVLDSHPEPIITVFWAAVIVIAKWLCIQPMAF